MPDDGRQPAQLRPDLSAGSAGKVQRRGAAAGRLRRPLAEDLPADEERAAPLPGPGTGNAEHTLQSYYIIKVILFILLF